MTKVLIFETDHRFAVELRTQLSELGCTVSVFKEGNTGMIAAVNTRPDLILLSVELPRTNGFSICNKLKKDPELSSVPLIIMSSSATPATFEQHKTLPTRAEDYVQKPIAFHDLLTRIQAIVPLGGQTDSVADDDAEDELTATVVRDVPAHLSSLLEAGGLNPFSEDRAAEPALELEIDIDMDDEATLLPTLERSVDERPPLPEPPAIGPGAAEPEFLQYMLGEDDEEKTEVAAQPNFAAMAAGNLSGATAPRVPPPLPTAASRGVHVPSAAPEGAEDEASEVETIKIAKLRQQLDAAQKRLSEAPGSMGSDVLALRESLQTKDKENLELREQLAHRDRDLINMRDQNLNAERKLAALHDERDEFEVNSREMAARVETLQADKALAAKRVAEFRQTALTLTEQLSTRSQELKEVQAVHAEAVRSVDQRLDDTKRELEEGNRQALRDVDQRQQSAIAELKAEHEATVQRLGDEHAEAGGALREQHTQALEQADQAHQLAQDQLKSELGELGGKHEEAVGAINSELQEAKERLVDYEQRLEHAARGRDEELATVRSEHQKAIDALGAEHEQRLELAQEQQRRRVDQLEQQREKQLERQAEMQEQALAQQRAEMTQAHEQALSERDAAHAQANSAFESARTERDAEHAQAISALESARTERDAEHTQAISVLETAQAQQLQTLRDEIEQTRALVVAELTEQHAERVREAEASFAAVKQTLEQERDAAVAQASTVRARLAELERRDEELEVQAASMMSERDELKAQADALGEALRLEQAKLEKARIKWGEDRVALQQAPMLMYTTDPSMRDDQGLR